MTISFWIALVALTALALAFLFYPLFFRSRAQKLQIDRRGENLANYRQRLAELDVDRDTQRIDATTYTILKEELDAALLEDIGDKKQGETRQAAAGRRSVVAVVITALIALPILAFGLYERWGASDALVQAEAMQALDQSGPVSPEQLEAMLTQLREHLEAEPANPDGWALLARTNMQLQRYEAAAEAYQSLARQLGEVPVAASAWGLVAQARYLESGRKWTDAVKRAVEQARAIDPNEVNALGLLGISAFERQAYQQAADHWTRILEEAPDYPQYAAIANGVVNAYRAMEKAPPESVQKLLVSSPSQGQGPSLDNSTTPETDQNQASVRVKVELSESLEQPDEEATVFVFARAQDGPPMPLAVTRLKLSELPTTVTLDDSMAMTPQARLSSAENIVVGARVSSTGSATPSPGDLEGVAEPVAVGPDMGTVEVVIDRQRP